MCCICDVLSLVYDLIINECVLFLTHIFYFSILENISHDKHPFLFILFVCLLSIRCPACFTEASLLVLFLYHESFDIYVIQRWLLSLSHMKKIVSSKSPAVGTYFSHIKFRKTCDVCQKKGRNVDRVVWVFPTIASTAKIFIEMLRRFAKPK